METNTELNDFDLNKGEIVEFTANGKKFKYKIPTNEDNLQLLHESREDGKIQVGKLAFMKLGNIVLAPYSKETINEVIKVNKDFYQLTRTEKLNLFSKLDTKITGELVNKITNAEKSDEDLKKN